MTSHMYTPLMNRSKECYIHVASGCKVSIIFEVDSFSPPPPSLSLSPPLPPSPSPSLSQAHPSESLLLAKSLYHDFCVLLPNAMEPLLQLPAFSPHMAFQMTKAFTTLHPFHIGIHNVQLYIYPNLHVHVHVHIHIGACMALDKYLQFWLTQDILAYVYRIAGNFRGCKYS